MICKDLQSEYIFCNIIPFSRSNAMNLKRKGKEREKEKERKKKEGGKR